MKKTFRLISMFLALLMVALALPITVAAETGTTTPQDGDMLFSLANLTEGTKEHASGYIESQTLSYVTLDGNDICASNSQYWKYAAVYTNLVRSASTKYTIEFYIKNHTTTYPWFMFSGNTYYWGHGFKYTNDSVIALTAKKTSVGSATVENGLKAYTDNDGYTRMVVEMNGADATAYVGGKRIVMGDLSTSSSNNLNRLSLIFVGVDVGAYTSGAILSVKDITVYQGCIADELNNRVEFTKDGELLDSKATIGTNTVLSETDFPTVTPATGKAVKWFIKNTDKIVSAPYTVTNDLMLEAREVDLNGTKVVGMQYTEPNSGTQSIRFLATLHDLNFSNAGFEVVAKYMDGTELKTRTWNVMSDVVYTAIEAEDGATGTVKTVTANELGGTYLIAIAINDVPTTIGQIDFYVTAIVGDSIESEQVTFTMNDGASDKTLALLEAPSAN